MEELQQYLTVTNGVYLLASLLGAFKASSKLEHHSGLCDRTLDLCLGVFCGVTAGMHFGETMTTASVAIISLVAGALGAITLEVVIELAPNIIAKKLKQLTKKAP